MFRLKLLIVIFIFLLIPKLAQSAQVDLVKYQGIWHEIYSIPQKFQKGCVNVTAEYSLNEDRKIKVVNVCRNKENGIEKIIEGEAVVKDLSKNYLKVYFYRPLGLNLFGGDYYILSFDPNYQWAIVGTPNHKYGWVLSRQAPLKEDLLPIIKEELKKLGFDFKKFNKTDLH